MSLDIVNTPKHTAGSLKQLQSLPLEAKIQLAKKRVNNFIDKFGIENVYISFSGGKDSTVLKHIIDSMYKGIPSVFVNTGLEYPEIRKFALEQENVVMIKPKLSFPKVIEKYGYPLISKEQSYYIYQFRNTKSDYMKNLRWNGDEKGSFKISDKWKYLVDSDIKISNKCCDVMKKAPIHAYEKETGRKGFVGTMVTESKLRLTSWLRHGCNAYELSTPQSRPLSVWTEQDILQYIKKYNVPICSVYGEVQENENGDLFLTGVKRTGCMFCMYGVHIEQEPNKFQQMKITHPRQYDFCINKLGLKKALDLINVKYV